MNRKNKALEILQLYQNGNYHYLGEGQEGIVFTDGIKVYKVYDSVLPETKRICLESSRNLLRSAIHLYEIEDIILFQGHNILIYPYEKSEPVVSLSEDDFVSFLAEMWQRKLIFSNMNPCNFIRVNKIIKLIDFEFKPYTDNLFLNMCVRSFIHLKYFGQEKQFIKKLERSAINNFVLPELNGIQEFVNKVFSTIIFKESQFEIKKFSFQNDDTDENIVEMSFAQLQNLDSQFHTSLANGLYLNQMEIKDVKLNENNYFEPKSVRLRFLKIKPFRKTVSLIIKTCPQDYETIYANVKHIVRQLSSPDTFFEKIIAIDGKEKNFTREYTDKGTLEKLMEQVHKLISEQIVDKYVTLPTEETAQVNNRWFGIETNATHCVNGTPVTPQLYAFEQANGEYIFQMDSDVMIARKDLSHSYLGDMVFEMENNEKVVSVGFNICQNFDIDYKPYFGFENGGFVPEVRMGLFHKERFFSLRPLPNSLDKSGNFQLSWYRAMEQKQKETGYCSIRGGDSRSFFIHPQNYRKTNTDVWTTILDRVENGYIPESQQLEFDCAGKYYDWTIPKRNEKMVVLCCLGNVEYVRFLRMFCSVASQTYQDWGMIIIDDASDNGLPIFIDNIIKPYLSKITFIKNRVRQGLTANIYKAIHYFISNPESVIATVDGDDAIVGNNVFRDIMREYDSCRADVVIGRMYQSHLLQAHYGYPVNFLHTRENNGGNVWQHIHSFKKYLFDSLDIIDLKVTNRNPTLVKKATSSPWLPDCTDYAMMIPIIEMSETPKQMDVFTYYREKQATNSQREAVKEQCITDILSKPQKMPSFVFKGRKIFLPNLNKIEIDITYKCNLKCVACNRSCSQVPTDEQLELADIERFISESIELGKEWALINILGGEPTLHRDFEKIIKYIYENYIIPHSPKTILQIVSNGLTEKTRDLLEKVKSYKNVTIDYNSFKKGGKIEYFLPFNDAPIDDEYFKDADYTKACWVTSYSGIGMNKYGYYGCDVCGGIDRVINENRSGIKNLKDITIEKFQEHFLKFCCLCGYFKDYDVNHGNFIPRSEKAPLKDNIISKIWESLYNRVQNDG